MQSLLLIFFVYVCSTCTSNYISILSPHTNQILLTDSVFLSLQINRSNFHFNDHLLCIQIRYNIELLLHNCFDSMSHSIYHHNHNIFSLFLNIPGQDKDDISMYLLQIFAVNATNNLVLQSESVYINVFSPYEVTSFPSMNNERTIADSTMLSDFDILKIRIKEHNPDIIIFDDTNAYFSNVESPVFKGYAFSTEYSLNTLSPHLHKSNNNVKQLYTSLYDNITMVDLDTFSILNGIELHSDNSNSSKSVVIVDQRDMMSDVRDNTNKYNSDNQKCFDENQARDGVFKTIKYLADYISNSSELSDDTNADDNVHGRNAPDDTTTTSNIRRSTLQLPDMIIISDSDEILSRDTINLIKTSPYLQLRSLINGHQKETIILVTLDNFIHKFNWRFDDRISIDEGPIIVPISLMKKLVTCPGTNKNMTASRIRRLFRHENTDSLVELLQDYNIVVWRSGGWHLSSFRTPSEECIMRINDVFNPKNEAFWNEKNCRRLQELGIPHYILMTGQSCEVILNRSPKFINTSSLLSGEIKVPQLIMRDHSLLYRHVLPDEYVHNESTWKQLVCDLVENVNPTIKSRMIYHATQDTGVWIQFTCSTDSDILKTEVNSKLFCATCMYSTIIDEDAKQLAYDSVGRQCSLENSNVVSLQILHVHNS